MKEKESCTGAEAANDVPECKEHGNLLYAVGALFNNYPIDEIIEVLGNVYYHATHKKERMDIDCIIDNSTILFDMIHLLTKVNAEYNGLNDN